MPYTAPLATPYTSGGVGGVITTRNITLKRGDGVTAGGGSATTLGVYLVESCNIAPEAKVVRRTGISGQGTDMAVIREPWKFTGKLQIANGATVSGVPTPLPGDFFEEVVDIGANGTINTKATRFVITACPKDETAGTPHTYSLTAEEDIENSPTHN